MIEYTQLNFKIWSRLGSCGAFGIAVMELASINDNVLALTSDLCTFSGLDRFRETYTDRFYNFGIAEQNMVGVASGLAKEGFIPFATTYATFATMRCADQIKVNMGYMKLGVKLVGLTSGLSVGILGPTHMCIEDLALMRSIPNIVILSPADCTETVKATIAAAEINTPVYFRLTGAMNNPMVYKEDYNFEIGKAITLKEGNNISIIATGTMVYNSLKAAELLEQQGISVKVINMHTIKPIDKKAIEEACNSQLIVTVEEHSRIGGLGSSIAEELAPKKNKPPQLIIGISDEYKHAGEYQHMIEQYGLEPEQILEKILSVYKGE